MDAVEATRTRRAAVDELAALCDEIEAISGANDVSWEDKYHLVFSDRVSGRFGALVREVGMSFSWDDPDGSYEDDVMAFTRAALERGRHVVQVVGRLVRPVEN